MKKIILTLVLTALSSVAISGTYVYPDPKDNELVCTPKVQHYGTWFTGVITEIQMVDTCSDSQKVSKGMLRDFHMGHSDASLELMPVVTVSGDAS